MTGTPRTEVRRRGAGKWGLDLVLAFLLALVTLYIAGVLSFALTLAGPIERTFATLALALIAGASVFLGWWLPRIALVGGAVVFVLVVFATMTGVMGQGIGSLDFFSALADGATSPSAPVLGVVLVCSSIASRLPRNRR